MERPSIEITVTLKIPAEVPNEILSDEGLMDQVQEHCQFLADYMNDQYDSWMIEAEAPEIEVFKDNETLYRYRQEQEKHEDQNEGRDLKIVETPQIELIRKLVGSFRNLHDACEHWDQNDSVLLKSRKVITEAQKVLGDEPTYE